MSLEDKLRRLGALELAAQPPPSLPRQRPRVTASSRCPPRP
jgi:hypothetical protein